MSVPTPAEYDPYRSRIWSSIVRETFTARRTWSASMTFACSVTAMSPAERIRPPSSRSRRLSPFSWLSRVFARRWASSITTPSELREFVDEQDALVGLVDRPRDDAVVGLRPELGMASVRIMPDVPGELRLGRPGGKEDRPPGGRDEELARALLPHLAALLTGLLVEHADHVPGALVDDDLFLPELLARRRHAIAAAELGEGDLEDAAKEIAERIPGVSLRRRLGPPALRAHPVRWRGIGPAMDALVSETLRHVDRRLLRVDQVSLGASEAALVRQHLVSLLHLDEGALRVLGVVDDPDLFRDRRQMEGQGLGDHGLPRARGSDEEEVAPLVRGDSGELHRLILADHAFQRVVRDRDLRRRLEVVEGESLVRREQLRPRDERHLDYGARSLRVQTTTPVGCFVIVPILVPTTECMFISAAMSRIRCVMMPSKTTARVCFAVFRVSTRSRTGTSVTTPSPSSRRRAVEEPPSWRSISRYFSNFGLRTFVVGVSGAGATSRNCRGSPRGSGRGSGLGSEPRSARPGGAPAGRASGNSDSGLYNWPESPYISTYWSAGTLFRSAFMICFFVC